MDWITLAAEAVGLNVEALIGIAIICYFVLAWFIHLILEDEAPLDEGEAVALAVFWILWLWVPLLVGIPKSARWLLTKGIPTAARAFGQVPRLLP